jgi:hypothetical protein
MVTFSSGDSNAAEGTTNNITSVIQTVLAAQMVSRGLLDGDPNNGQAQGVPVTRVQVPAPGPKQNK